MKDLPQGWRETRLGELGRYLNGYAFNAKTWSKSGRPIIRIQNLTGSSNTFNFFEGDIADRYVVRNGDLLISWAATLGAFIWRGEEAVLNQHIFKVESHINLAFHRYLIDQKLDEMMRVTHGSGMVHITKGNFDNVSVALPPLAEQESIVEILEEQFSRLDSALASVKAVREKAKAFRRSLLHSAFSGELTGGTEGWREVALGDISVVKGGKRLPKGTKWSPNPTAHPYIRATDVQATGIDTKGLVYVPDEVWAGIARYVVASGDVVITIAGTIGRTAVVSTLLDGANLTENAAKIVLNKSVVSSWFLDYFLKSPLAQEVIESLSTSTTQAKLALFRIETIAIPLPPLAEQERIVSLLEEQFSRLDKALEVANQLEARIASERRSLLHSAFTGALTATWRQNND